MTQFTRALMIADSNGQTVQLPGDATRNPNNPVFKPYYTDGITQRFNSIHVSTESTGVMFVEFWLRGTQVAPATLLYPGVVVDITADRVIPVGVRRAGEMWCMLSDTVDTFRMTRSDLRPVFRGAQYNVYPLTQVSLYVGGPLSNLWCHPNSAPGAATPMYSGTAQTISGAALIGVTGYTAANWSTVYLAAFNVDPDTQSVVNVRRLMSNMPASPANIGTLSLEVNTWDRLGMIAIPSAANPNPALAPLTVAQFLVEGYSTYSRNIQLGYLGVGADGGLP